MLLLPCVRFRTKLAPHRRDGNISLPGIPKINAAPAQGIACQYPCIVADAITVGFARSRILAARKRSLAPIVEQGKKRRHRGPSERSKCRAGVAELISGQPPRIKKDVAAKRLGVDMRPHSRCNRLPGMLVCRPQRFQREKRRASFRLNLREKQWRSRRPRIARHLNARCSEWRHFASRIPEQLFSQLFRVFDGGPPRRFLLRCSLTRARGRQCECQSQDHGLARAGASSGRLACGRVLRQLFQAALASSKCSDGMS